MRWRAACLGLAAALAATPAFAADPPVPIGQDPGGTAVAIISTGIDYTLPDIAARLARDGEGELIGWDFVDGDNRPFAPSPLYGYADVPPDATTVASLLSGAGLRLVVVRVTIEDPNSLANAVSFLSRTPTRMAVVTSIGHVGENWSLFRQAAVHFADMRFITLGSKEKFPAALGLKNVVPADECHLRVHEPDQVFAKVCQLMPSTPTKF